MAAKCPRCQLRPVADDRLTGWCGPCSDRDPDADPTEPRVCQLAVDAGELLQAARQADGLSRRAKAAAIGVAPPTLREVELGEANPTVERLEAIGREYGVQFVIAGFRVDSGLYIGKPAETLATEIEGIERRTREDRPSAYHDEPPTPVAASERGPT